MYMYAHLLQRQHAYLHMEGSQLRNWLLHFSLPVLWDMLPSQYLSHLALLVCTIYIVSSESISEENLLSGKCLLKQFYCDLYGGLNVV